MTTKPFVFVLMPFDNSFDDIYKIGIKETCEKLNCYCERVDEQIFEENILQRIYNQILKADLVIADLTHKNPNVYYETGYAHALGKKVVLLTQKAEDIPFDLKHYPHIIYEGKILSLQKELKRKVDWFTKNPETKSLPNDSSIELFIGGKKLESGKTLKLNREIDVWDSSSYECRVYLDLKIDIHNSDETVSDTKILIGILAQNGFSRNNKQDKINIVQVDEDSYLHLSTEFNKILPLAWNSFSCKILSNEENLFNKKIPIEIQLFTEFSSKKYLIEVEFTEKEIELV